MKQISRRLELFVNCMTDIDADREAICDHTISTTGAHLLSVTFFSVNSSNHDANLDLFYKYLPSQRASFPQDFVLLQQGFKKTKTNEQTKRFFHNDNLILARIQITYLPEFVTVILTL